MFGRHFELYLNSGAICVCWMESKTISIVSCANRFRSFSTRLDCSCKFAKKKRKKKKCESKRFCVLSTEKQPHHHHPGSSSCQQFHRNHCNTAGKWLECRSQRAFFQHLRFPLLPALSFRFSDTFPARWQFHVFYQYARLARLKCHSAGHL